MATSFTLQRMFKSQRLRINGGCPWIFHIKPMAQITFPQSNFQIAKYRKVLHRVEFSISKVRFVPRLNLPRHQLWKKTREI